MTRYEIRKFVLPLVLTWIVEMVSADSNDVSFDLEEEWVVRVKGGPEVAALLAVESGYVHVSPVLGFKDTYLWQRNRNPNQRKRGMPYNFKSLKSSPKIIWADQQRVITRHKRDYIPSKYFESEKPVIREKRLYPDYDLDIILRKDRQHLERIGKKRRKSSGRSTYDLETPKAFNDELWDQEWYLQDTRTNKALPKLDLNVLPLYRRGITGKGVRVAVLDDGLEYSHDDLRNNYDPEISYDINERDDDPFPRYDLTGMNGHGTRCAGEIAMEANNHKCGVGVAYEASIGGIKLLDGIVNDRVEGEALGYKPESVDIYTASWGPSDDGTSLEAPGRLASEALERGTKEGRNGKGSIYVWASGNGGSKSDDCGCDGYVGSIYTVAVGSASKSGRFPWYGEICPATLATTYSSGAYHDQMIATTDLKNTCTTSHTGTSASAPLAAGILALALQVNKDLTWRDVQHLVAWTSEYSPLRDNPGWFKNAAGFWFNPRFGFGLMNAYALVTTSANWTTVPQKFVCEIASSYLSDSELSYGVPRRLEFEADQCTGTSDEIVFLEHVQVEANIEYSNRGSLQMNLTAPSGTMVPILGPRKLDNSTAGFSKWKFMSVAAWGENPGGIWSLDIFDKIGPEDNNGTIGEFTLILHGTKEAPQYRKIGPRIYDDDYNRVRKTNVKASMDNSLYSEFHKGIDTNELDELSTQDWLLRFLFL